MKVGGREIQVDGGLLRIARLAADKFDSVDDPGATLEALRESGIRIDLFTFMQKLPDTSPKYDYPMEWDNVAALPVSTFDQWWTKQINGKTRNTLRIGERKGIVVREVPFDDALVRGISVVYNESPIRQGKPFPHYGKDLETVRRENGTFLERSFFIGAFLEENLVGFAKLVCDRASDAGGPDADPLDDSALGQSPDECADRPGGPLLRRAEDRAPRVLAIRLRKKATRQPQRFQAAQRLPADRPATVLCPSHPDGPAGPSSGTAPPPRRLAFPNRFSPSFETLAAAGTARDSGRQG